MAINLTPATTPGADVSVGDDVVLECTIDQQVANRAELSLVIMADGTTTTITADDPAVTETDNGDGTWTYAYTYTLASRVTRGRWTLDSAVQGRANTNWYIIADPQEV